MCNLGSISAQKFLNLGHYQLGQGHYFLSDLTLFNFNLVKASDDI